MLGIELSNDYVDLIFISTDLCVSSYWYCVNGCLYRVKKIIDNILFVVRPNVSMRVILQTIHKQLSY